MRTLSAAIIITAMMSCALAHASERVSIIQLIANPALYHGKKVIVSGFLNIEFEGTAIYLHRDDCTFSQYSNGLWCSINETRYGKYNKRYVVMEGVFNREMKGHLGLWSGSIENIERVWEPHTSAKRGK
ncbi:MAG TPA: hypothetical protein PKY31_05015 [Spirochaetota bacterium]|nr:hypothetical protein [Spirochaetota bacterium]